jgi:hypothetical protein
MFKGKKVTNDNNRGSDDVGVDDSFAAHMTISRV